MSTNRVRKRPRSQKVFDAVVYPDEDLDLSVRGKDEMNSGRRHISNPSYEDTDVDIDAESYDNSCPPAARHRSPNRAFFHGRGKNLSTMERIGRSSTQRTRRHHHKNNPSLRPYVADDITEDSTNHNQYQHHQKQDDNRKRIFPGQQPDLGAFPYVASKRLHTHHRKQIPSFDRERERKRKRERERDYDRDILKSRQRKRARGRELDDLHIYTPNPLKSKPHTRYLPRDTRDARYRYQNNDEDDMSSLGPEHTSYQPPYHHLSAYRRSYARPRREYESPSSPPSKHHARPRVPENISIISNEDNINESPRHYRSAPVTEDRPYDAALPRYATDRRFLHGPSSRRQHPTQPRDDDEDDDDMEQENVDDDDDDILAGVIEPPHKRRYRPRENDEEDAVLLGAGLHSKHGSSLPEKNLAFSFGNVTLQVDIHVMVMPAKSHEQNLSVVESFLPRFAYTAYPSRKKELRALAYAENFPEMANVVAKMFDKLRSGMHIHVEFVDVHDLTDSSKGPLTLVVGCHENELIEGPQTIQKLTLGVIIVIKQGPFKGGRGMIKNMTKDRVMVQMQVDCETVYRWVNKSCVEVMDTQQLLQTISTKQLPSPTDNFSSTLSFDADMTTALYGDIFEGDEIASTSLVASSMPETHVTSKTHQLNEGTKRKFLNDPLFAEMDDHSFFPSSVCLGEARADDGDDSILAPLLTVAHDQFVDEDTKLPAKQMENEHEHQHQLLPQPEEQQSLSPQPEEQQSLSPQSEEQQPLPQFEEQQSPTQSEEQQPSQKFEEQQLSSQFEEQQFSPQFEEQHPPQPEEYKDEAKATAVVYETTTFAVAAASSAANALAHQQLRKPTHIPKELDAALATSAPPVHLKIEADTGTKENNIRIHPLQLMQDFAGRLSRTPTGPKSEKQVFPINRGPPKNRCNLGAALSNRERPPPPSKLTDTATEIKSSVSVNTFSASAAAQVGIQALSGVATSIQTGEGAAPNALSAEDEGKGFQQSFQPKRKRGRPPKSKSGVCRSDWELLQSFSVLHLRAKLKEMHLTTKGNKEELFERLADALNISENSPTDRLLLKFNGSQQRG